MEEVNPQSVRAHSVTPHAVDATAKADQNKIVPLQEAATDIRTGKNVPRSSNELAGEQPSVEPEVVEQAVVDLNDFVQSIQRDIQFSLDEDSGKSVIRVVDRQTQELIRQMPSDVALRLAQNLKDNEATSIELFSARI